jgi:hypothetical protein
LTPADFPANPLEKPGYTREFHDEFDGQEIDTDKWIPYYLAHWSSRDRSAPRYEMRDGALVLQITKDQSPWCPEFDGEVKCSSIQTGAFAGPVGSAVGQHRFSAASVVREAQPNAKKYVPQYGYFEIRRTLSQSPNYPMQFMLSIYERPQGAGAAGRPEPDARYPKEFTVDYFRAYSS